ncbi:hypothetical protein PBI_SCTP2_242 [Salicola phage SCTP-2]|nr:hypothetical protein PBI_SCTP2_242 [Salicola phage SCTP-2]
MRLDNVDNVDNVDRILFESDPDEVHRQELEKTGFWGKKGAGCLLYSVQTDTFLFLQRSAVVEQPHTWNLAGGAIDPEENSKKAAIRELYEETQINVSEQNTHLIHTYKDDNSSFVFFNFLSVIDNEQQPVLNWENKDYVWESIDNHPEPLHFGLKEFLFDQKVLEKIKNIIDKYQ